jgi:glycosyltransferase involved in cell wall biosynthesis
VKIAVIFDGYGKKFQPFWLEWSKNLRKYNLPVEFYSNWIEHKKTNSFVVLIRELNFLQKTILHLAMKNSFTERLKWIKKIGYKEILKSKYNQYHFLNVQTYPKYKDILPLEKCSFSFRGYDLLVRPEIDPAWKEDVKTILSKGKTFHFVSDFIRRKAQKFGADPSKCSTIYRSVNPIFFSDINKDPGKGPVKIISVGRLTWQKGFDIALMSLKGVSDQTKNWEYRIIGEGSEKEKIQNMIRYLGLGERVKILDPVSPESLSKIMERSEILLHPSITEALPNVILEAGASKMAVLASDCDGIPEIVQHGKNGLLVTFFDVGELTTNLVKLIEDFELREKLGSALQTRVRTIFSIKNEMRSWKKFYSIEE